ncbi:MAG: MFS transporter [bacterium]
MQRRPLLRLFPVLVLNVIEIGIALPVLPALALAHGGDAVDVGLLYMVQSLGQFIMAPAWGAWSDRIGRKRVLILTFLLAAVGEALTAFAPSLALLYAARVLVGLCAGNIATGSALVSDLTDASSRSRGMAMVGISFGLGFTIGPGVGALVAHFAPDTLSWDGVALPFVVASALSVFTALIGVYLIEEPELSPSERAARRAARRGSLRELAASPGIAPILGMFFTYTFAASVLEATYFLYAAQTFALKEEHVGAIFAGLGFLLAGVQGSVGRVSDRFGVRPMTQAGAIIVVVGLLLTSSAPSVGTFVAATAVVTMGRAWLHPGLLTLGSNEGDVSSVGRILGLVQSSGSLGRIAGAGAGGSHSRGSRPRLLSNRSVVPRALDHRVVDINYFQK